MGGGPQRDVAGRLPAMTCSSRCARSLWQSSTPTPEYLRAATRRSSLQLLARCRESAWVVARTTLESYRTANPEWDVIIDVDELAKADGQSWVWGGADVIEPDLSRALIVLSPADPMLSPCVNST